MMSSKEIIGRLKKEGWEHFSTTGSHTVWRKKGMKILVVPHPRKDFPMGTFKSICKTAGWN